MIHWGQDAEADAIAWHVRLGSGDATDEDRRGFALWRQASANRRAFAEVEALWGGLRSVLEKESNVVPLRRPSRGLFAGRWPALAVAASIMAIVSTGYEYVHVWRYGYATQGVARRDVGLVDGSRIALNTDAALDVDYSGALRRVRLARGEAFFDVRHNPARPFVVSAGSGEVRVLGTAFSVSRDGAGGRVVVRRGKVRVLSGRDVIDITPNQSVTFSGAGNGRVLKVDAASDLAWSEGRLFFKNMPLRDVITAVNRYYPGKILLTNRAAADRRISAAIRLDEIDDWFTALGRSQNVTVHRLPGIVLLR